MIKVGVINFGMGNVQSVLNGLKYCSINSDLIIDYKKIPNYDVLILPGVGAFGEAMNNLKARNFINPIKNHIKKNKKIIGICLGMQLLFENSFEFGKHTGLGLIEGDVLPFPDNIKLNIPHVGWNNVKPINKRYNEFSDDFYFVHSFYCKPKNKSEIIFQTKYGIEFCSGIKKENIYGVQFHPEKSHLSGLNLLKIIINE